MEADAPEADAQREMRELKTQTDLLRLQMRAKDNELMDLRDQIKGLKKQQYKTVKATAPVKTAKKSSTSVQVRSGQGAESVVRSRIL